jgi:4-amino-4-deoxy-L-arabinose transferase-like glycosyltransferase
MSHLARRPWLLLVPFCAFLFLYGVDSGDLWRTESLRAIIAAECLHGGHWVVPTLYGQPLLTKPPGMYAAIALVSWPFGEVTDITARLPSALAATATVFLFYWYFGRCLGRRAGLVAGLIVPISLLWLDKAPSAEMDMLQLAWVSAAMLLFMRALEVEEAACCAASGGVGWWIASLLCVAGGFLTKWTAPAFFYATVVPLLWWRGRLRLLFSWRHVVSAALAAALCLGWAALVVQAVGWDEFATTVGREAMQRLSPVQHNETIRQLGARHERSVPPWLKVAGHPFAVLAMSLPWSAFALLAFWPRFATLWDERGKRLLQALHCWTWPNLLFWSLLPDHSPRYSLPLLPGISGLAALVWIAWMNGARLTRAGWLPKPAPWGRGVGNPPPRGGLGSAAIRALGVIVALWLVVKIVHVHAVIPARSAHRELPRATGDQLAAAVPPGQTLYLCRVKDEGIMFYYGRPVRRLASFAELPSPGEPLYCMLEESEWLRGAVPRPSQAVLHLRDQQRAPIVLVKVTR